MRQPQKSSSRWTEQSPDGYKYSLGVTVTRPARGSLPTPARRWVPSTITQKLDRQPRARACCHCSISGTHCRRATPGTAEGLPPSGSSLCADSTAVRGPCPGDLWGPGLLCGLSRDRHGMQRDEHHVASLFQIIICNTGMKAASEFCLLGRSTVQETKKKHTEIKENCMLLGEIVKMESRDGNPVSRAFSWIEDGQKGNLRLYSNTGGYQARGHRP